MKTVNFEALETMFFYGDHTAFVYDACERDFEFADADFTEDSVYPFSVADDIQVRNISELPNIKQIMQDNYLPIFRSAEGYDEIVKMFTENKAQIASCFYGSTMVHMLIW